MWIALSLLGLGACGGGRSACGAEELPAGSAEAEVAGEPWSADAVSWAWAGSSLQVNAEASGGWLLSLVAQWDRDGVDLEAAAAGDFPVEVDLADGGFAVMYPSEGGSYASNKGEGGSLSIAAIDREVLGCFSFEAASAEGETLEVRGGAFRASGE